MPRRARAAEPLENVAAAESLAKLAKQLARAPRRAAKGTRPPPSADASAREAIEAREAGPFDLATSPRQVSLELIGGRGHYERVIAAVLAAHTSVWIATANVKGLMVEDHRAAPGRRRSMRRSSYVSILSLLDDLAARGVELRLLHAELPSGPFREEIANHPRLVAGGLALARCPRVHMKAVIVDGALLYLGSANWTGAGLGAKGTGRRNFELGIVTEDGPLLDQVQGLFEQIWSGGECDGCKVRELCPGPLDEVRAIEGRAPAVLRPRRKPARTAVTTDT
ncbi:MAG: Phospholipase protein [Myxococcales bacterium]|nr:Phospholipase protein [Myxococcales bacterium]